MRFIHASDLHIDSPLGGLGRYEGAPVERLRTATHSALERLVDKAISEQVDFVLLAGDIYDRDWQDFHTGLFFREQMVRLGRANIRVFIIQGNHDAQGVISAGERYHLLQSGQETGAGYLISMAGWSTISNLHSNNSGC